MSLTSAELIEECGITYRQLDYWTRQGYVEPEGEPSPGSGNRRKYSDDEVQFVKVLAALAKTGMRIDLAAELAVGLDFFGFATLGPFTINLTEEQCSEPSPGTSPSLVQR